jgi:hypothetical protein
MLPKPARIVASEQNEEIALIDKLQPNLDLR